MALKKQKKTLSEEDKKMIEDQLGSAVTVISQSSRLKGTITGQDQFLILGNIEGDINCEGMVWITKKGKVDGNVKALKVIKRDGRCVEFEADRIRRAVEKAFRAAGAKPDETFGALMGTILEDMDQEFSDRNPAVEAIQDIVEKALIEDVSRQNQFLYRHNHSLIF